MMEHLFLLMTNNEEDKSMMNVDLLPSQFIMDLYGSEAPSVKTLQELVQEKLGGPQ